MKELKDYLHLYLGCKMKEKNSIVILSGVSHDSTGKYFVHLIFEESKYYVLFIDEVKPILRPLSDMTVEEKSHVDFDAYQILRGETKLLAGMYGGFIWSANQTKYLLSKHFDLFGLIEAGLAIDATTLIPNSKQ